MKKQRLSVLDISVLAIEMGDLLKDRVIESITLAGQRLKFQTDNADFAFAIISGNPYIFRDSTPEEGSLRFRNLINGKIESVSQVNDDRIICLEIIAFNKLGLRKKHKLYFELYGNGNVVLTDENGIIREIYRGAANRQIGKEYQLPQSANQSFLQFIRDNKFPHNFSWQLANLNILPLNSIVLDDEALARLIEKAIKHPIPYLLKDINGSPCGFAIVEPPFIESIRGEKRGSLMGALSEYVDFISKSDKIRGNIENPQVALKKAQFKLKAIQDELSQAENAFMFRQYGEIILANLGIIQKGMKKLYCGNPYSLTGDFIEIPLTPSLTAEKNAAHYFEKARKMEASIEILKRRLANQQLKIDELIRNRNLPPNSNLQRSAKSLPLEKNIVKLPFHQVDLADGWRIYIGKSAESNDELTFSFAKKDDIWFHAWQAAGSHVILRRPNKGDIPPKKYLIRAAELAAYNSKAKSSAKVPVIYTEARYVRKVRGTTGKVIVTNEKQLMVKPTGPEKTFGD